MPNTIYAFLGRQGSGKTHQSNKLTHKTFSLATPLRRVYGFDVNNADYDKFKADGGREQMQKLADKVRAFDSTFFVKILIQDIILYIMANSEKDNVIGIDDVRFKNEYETIEQFCLDNDFELKAWFCDYKRGEYPPVSHKSEEWAQFLLDNNC